MALDKLTLLDETIINNTATSVATTVVNNSAQTNYISFPVATANPLSNGWRVYSDGASTSPVDGTGGSPNTTLTQNTSSPLNSTGDFRITKTTGASRQGEGISTDFTIANRHLAKVLQISFDYEVVTGSTLANDDLRVYIIANPTVTPVVIEPVNVSIQGVLSGTRVRHLATFQTDFTITTYRLCIHIATTTSSNQNIDFNNFRVWEQSQTIGAIITEPQSYIATIKGGTSDPSKGSNILTESGSWHREGKHLILRYNLRIGTAGTAGTGNYFFLLPSGLSIDYTLASGFGSLSGVPVVGSAYVSYSGGQATGSAVLAGSTSTYPNAIQIVLNANGNVVGQNAYSLGNGDMSYGFQATIPIAGWGSSVAMSSDTGDGRVVAAKYRNQPSQTSSATVPLQFTTLEYDTHNAVTVGTVNTSNAWRYTAPVSGYYRITVSSYCNTTATAYFLYRNGVSVGRIADFSNSIVTSSSNTILLNSGDFIDIRCGQSFPAYSDAYISIERISAGSQVIASSENVNVICRTVSNSISSSYSSPSWTSKEVDSHGAFTASSSRFTAPMSGIYRFSANFGTSNGNAGLIRLLDVSTSTSLRQTLVPQDASSRLSVSLNTELRLISGQQIDVQFSIISGTATLSVNLFENFLSITRVGNY